jgi:hypothetical protein
MTFTEIYAQLSTIARRGIGIPKEEKDMIRYLVVDIRKGSCPNFPYPAGQDTERLMRFRTVGGNPFTVTEEQVGLFTDLG